MNDVEKMMREHNYVSCDKIRAKIEKLEKYNKTTQLVFGGSVNDYMERAQITILKELLEE